MSPASAARMLAILGGIQASLDVFREELEREIGIERRPPTPPERSGMPPMYGRAQPAKAPVLERLHEAAAAADRVSAADTSTDPSKE